MWVIAEISVPSVKRFGGVVCAQRTRATPPLSGCPTCQEAGSDSVNMAALVRLQVQSRVCALRAVQRGITGIGDPPKVDIARHRISAFRVGRRPEHRRLEPFVRALNDGAQYSGFTLFASAYAGFIKYLERVDAYRLSNTIWMEFMPTLIYPYHINDTYLWI